MVFFQYPHSPPSWCSLKGQTVDGFYNKKEEKEEEKEEQEEEEVVEEGGKTIMKAPAASSKPPFILRHDIDTAMLPVLLVHRPTVP